MSEFERGKADSLRDQSIKIRLSESEKDRLDRLASGMGMTVASFVRFVCITNVRDALAGGHSLDTWSKVKDYSEFRIALNAFSGELAKTRAAVNKVGNNVNQIARSLNERKPVDASMCRSMRLAQECLGDIHDQIDSIAEDVETLSVSYERLGDE